jgi:hypothetical protein
MLLMNVVKVVMTEKLFLQVFYCSGAGPPHRDQRS